MKRHALRRLARQGRCAGDPDTLGAASPARPDWNAPWHQAYLAWYDRVGPWIAQRISKKPWLKATVRASADVAAWMAGWGQR